MAIKVGPIALILSLQRKRKTAGGSAACVWQRSPFTTQAKEGGALAPPCLSMIVIVLQKSKSNIDIE